jgi:hypothetical protein
MPYLSEPDQNAQNPQQGQAQQPMTAPPSTSSAPGAGPGSSTGKSGAPQATPAQPFQNLSSYLSANAPQVQQQGAQIAGNLNTQYGQVTSDINKGASDFGGQVAGGYAAPNDALTNSAASNPTAFVQNPNDVKAFQSLYNDAYTGPTAYETTSPYAALNTEATNAASNATNFDTIPGMQTYFANNNPNATAGGNTLDATLLSGNPDAYAQVQNAAKPFAGLSDYLAGTVTAQDKAAADANTAATNEATAVQNQFTGAGGVVPTFQSNVNSELATDVGQTNAYNTAVNGLLSKTAAAQPYIAALQDAIPLYNSVLTSDQAASKGKGLIPSASPESNNYKSINLPSWTIPTATLSQPTLAQAATPSDIAEQNALQQLLGSNYSPQFDATGAVPFNNPGAPPTLSSIIGPALSNLEGQSLDPDVFISSPVSMTNPGFTGGRPQSGSDYVTNVTNAEKTLQNYLSGNS